MKIYKKIKPLSVNECWQGRRYKTRSYKDYEAFLLYNLPQKELPKPPYEVKFTFGLSNMCADWDNPIKPLQDILQKKYGFNDKDVLRGVVDKVKVKKGEEFFNVEILQFS